MKILMSYFSVFRELKKAQMAKAAAEERALFTDRMATRSTTQSNRTSRLIGKKMNRSVSLTIYWTPHFPLSQKKKLWQEEARLKSLLGSSLQLLSQLVSVVFTEIPFRTFILELQLKAVLRTIAYIRLSSSLTCLSSIGYQLLLDVTSTFPRLTTVVVCCL